MNMDTLVKAICIGKVLGQIDTQLQQFEPYPIARLNLIITLLTGTVQRDFKPAGFEAIAEQIKTRLINGPQWNDVNPPTN